MTATVNSALLDMIRRRPGRMTAELAALLGATTDDKLSALADELCTLLWETKVVSGPKRFCRVAREDRPVWYAMDEVLGEA